MFPSELKIGPHVWILQEVPNGVLHQSGHLGLSTADSLVIAVDANLPPTKKLEVLLHEVLHACCEGTMLGEDDEESLVRIIAPALLGVIRENPDLVAVLLSE